MDPDACLQPRLPPSRYHPCVFTLLSILQVIIAGTLIFLILLHSGKDTGLSGAFGIGGGGSAFGGGSMVERNLDRATVFFAVLFVLNTLVLLKI
jgi:preprotein translocase subunit SecG